MKRNRKQKNPKSIFMNMLIPMITVIFLETLAMYAVIFAGGIFQQIEENHIDILKKSGDNRYITLRNDMLSTWSDLDFYVESISSRVEEICTVNNISPSEIIGNNEYSKMLSEAVAPDLIDTLRGNKTSGAFFIVSNGQEKKFDTNEEMYFYGTYFRDLDPLSNAVGNSDLLMERGYAGVASKFEIPLDSFWLEKFRYSKKSTNMDFWKSYIYPYKAMLENPDYSLRNLGYWNTECCLYDYGHTDSNYFISYSVPVIVNKCFIGILGIEIQQTYLTKYIPAGDIENTSSSGYMLLQKVNISDALDFEIIDTTGGMNNRIRNSGKIITLVKSSSHEGLYSIKSNNSFDISVNIQDLRLYNNNTSFNDNAWYLASTATNTCLFGKSEIIRKNMCIIAVISFAISFVLIFIAARFTTKPIVKMASLISKQNDVTKLTLPETNTVEINELSNIINNLSFKQRKIEAELREEKERYLLAIESTYDIIIEYHIPEDVLRIFHVSNSETNGVHYNEYRDFKRLVHQGRVCHEQDINKLLNLIMGRTSEQQELRIRAKQTLEYYWFSCKVKPVYDEMNHLVKVIGSTRNITEHKQKELAEREAIRRDNVSGLLNKNIGKKEAELYINHTIGLKTDFVFITVEIENYTEIENVYGVLFCDGIIAEAGSVVNRFIVKKDIAFRLSGNIFCILLNGTTYKNTAENINNLYNALLNIYSGESADTSMRIMMGIVDRNEGADFRTFLEKSLLAIRYSEIHDMKTPVLFSEISNDLTETALSFQNFNFIPIPKLADSISGNIINFAFNIFEKTQDVKSVTNLILAKIGRIFKLLKITIVEFDSTFNSSYTLHKWTYNTGVCDCSSLKAEKPEKQIPLLISENLGNEGVFLLTPEKVKDLDSDTKKCFGKPDDNSFVMICLGYDKGKCSSAIIYETNNKIFLMKKNYEAVREVSKIIVTNINRFKSDSASRAKSEFLSRMSHEIRTPMNAITGMTTIAKDCIDDKEKVADCLDKIDDTTKFLLSLINDILDMSRIESGKVQIEQADMNIDTMVKKIDTIIRPQTSNKNINFVTDIRVTNKNLIGDSFRLSQVLLNLLGNAVKFTDPEGTVTLSAVQQNTGENAVIRFSVKDTGIGITKEGCERIFNAFEQAEVNTSRRFGGTGLGLSISKNIVAMMGGKLEVNSTYGVGSEFFFTLSLPVADYDEASQEENTSEEFEFDDHFKGKRALLVEDNELNTEIAVYILETGGFEIDTAVNGQEAVEKFSSSDANYYDIIFMDIRMPVMDGFEATKAIRSLERKDAMTVPIVAMTADAFDDDMKKSIASGMNGHIAKPIDTDKLAILVDKLIFKS